MRSTMCPSPAAPSMRISRKTLSSGRSGLGCSFSVGAGVACLGQLLVQGYPPALTPADYRDNAYVTGIEFDPVTARITRPLQPAPGSSMAISPVPTCRQSTTSPSATRPSPIARSAPTEPIVRSAFACMTIYCRKTWARSRCMS